MVKSYDRFEPGAVFGLVSSQAAVIDIPGGSAGRVAVGAGEAVLLWDLKTGEQIARLADARQVSTAQAVTLAYERTSSLLAAGYSDGSIIVWDLQSRSPLITFNGHKTAVSVLRFDPSGTRLFSGAYDTNIVCWDLVEEIGLFRLKGHKANITGLDLVSGDDGDAAWLLSTSKDGILKLWDLKTQYAVESHIAHKNECWAAALVDRQFVTASNGTELKLWHVDVSKPEGSRISAFGTLEKHSRHRPVGLQFSGDLLYCASADAVQVWKQRTAEELKKVIKRKEKRAAKKDNKKEAVDASGGSDDVEATKPSTTLTGADIFIQQALLRTRAKVYSIALHGTERVITNLANNSIEEWSITNGDEPERVHAIELPGHRTDIRDLSISLDNKLIVSGSNGLIKLYNSRSRSVLRTIEGAQYVLCVRFLPGNALVVAGTKEGTIDIYDMATSSIVESIAAHDGAVWSIDLSPDGKSLVSGSADKSVKFWELRILQKEVDGQPGVTVPTMTLKNTHKLEFSDEVLAVKLSPDDRLVAASLLDNTIKVYYRDSLKFFLNLYGHQLPVLSLDISFDSKLLISSSADKNIKIWGLDFGDVHKSIFAHDDSVLRVVFDPQTHFFFSCSKDGLVKYWDGDKFQQIQKLSGHKGEVWALAVSSDGTFLATASHDKSIRLWERTDEPVFIEEERENELEESYEENLAESLERDNTHQENGEGDEDSAEAVSRHTIESLKAGERFYEALQIATADLEREDKSSARHVILSTLNVSPERYLLDTLLKIKPSLVEDALLTFPLESVNSLFKFISIWVQNRWNVSLASRILFFCLRVFHKQIVANKMLQIQLEELRDALRIGLIEVTDQIGTNVAHLKFVREQYEMEHVHSFDEPEVETIKKREFPSLQV